MLSSQRTSIMAMTLCVAAALGGCGPHEPRADRVLALRGDAAHGTGLYGHVCAACHAHAGYWRLTLAFYGGNGFVSTLIDGVPRSKMPSFAAWSDQDLADVYAYVRTLK